MHLALATRRRAVLRRAGWALPLWTCVVVVSVWQEQRAVPVVGAVAIALSMVVGLIGYGLAWLGKAHSGAHLMTSGAIYATIWLCVIGVLRDPTFFLLACGALGVCLIVSMAFALALASVLARDMVVVGVIAAALNGYLLDGAAPLPASDPWLRVVALLAGGGCLVSVLAVNAHGVAELHRQAGQAEYRIMLAQFLDADKDLVAASLSHELRTPFMALFGNIGLLQTRWETMSPDRITMLLARCMRVGHRYRRLLNDIQRNRDVQGIENFVPAAVPVKQTIKYAVQEVLTAWEEDVALDADGERAAHVARDLTVAIAEDLQAWGHPGYIQQIITNLLTNALKYTPAGSSIEIATSTSAPVQKGSRMLDLRVRDYGPGIPPLQHELIFSRYTRLERDVASATRKGTGLGLWLCREYARAMGGEIWVESTGIAGEGSTFVVRLPLAITPAEVHP